MLHFLTHCMKILTWLWHKLTESFETCRFTPAEGYYELKLQFGWCNCEEVKFWTKQDAKTGSTFFCPKEQMIKGVGISSAQGYFHFGWRFLRLLPDGMDARINEEIKAQFDVPKEADKSFADGNSLTDYMIWQIKTPCLLLANRRFYWVLPDFFMTLWPCGVSWKDLNVFWWYSAFLFAEKITQRSVRVRSWQIRLLCFHDRFIMYTGHCVSVMANAGSNSRDYNSM